MPDEQAPEVITPASEPIPEPELTPEQSQAESDRRRRAHDDLIAERARQARGANAAPPGGVVYHPTIAGGAWLDLHGRPIPQQPCAPGPTELALAASRKAVSDAMVERIGPEPLFERDEQYGLLTPADYEKVQAQRAAYGPSKPPETEDERAELRRAERARMRAHLLGGGK